MSGRFATLIGRWRALWVTAIVGAVACSGCKAPGGPDADVDAGPDGGGAPDTGFGPCWGNTGCDDEDGTLVRSCEPGVPSTVVEICAAGLTCSLGRCVSPSCAFAQTQASIAGCLFYVVALDNVDSDDAKPTLIVVTNPGSSGAAVDLEERALGQPSQPWTKVESIAIDGGSAGGFSVGDRHVEGMTYAAALARRVVSDTPVTAMVVQSDDDELKATSSAGTMLLPSHALGWRYMAMTYQQKATAELSDLAGSRAGAGEIAIVATQDRTTLKIWPPGAPDGTPPTESSLQSDGDVYQIVSDTDLDDLSGTTIWSDKPIAVFSGNVVTTYGKEAAGINSPDMAMEQMLPTTQWSKSYVAARLPPQDAACDTLFGLDPSLGPAGYWRIIATEMTEVRFTSAAPMAGLPLAMRVARGLPYELLVAGAGDFVVHADVPILVTQGMDCEPTLSSAVPAEAPAGPQVFALPPNFEHALAIVRKNDRTGPRVILDDLDIGYRFKPVAEGFEVAHVQVPPCYGSVDHCVHRLAGAYGLTLRGMDVACSYATTRPTWFRCTDICP